MREIDRLTTERFATPSLLLMEAAANAVARATASRLRVNFSELRTLILCGRGNNGGDGAALARVLWMRGARVSVVLFGRVEDTHGDARVNFEMTRRLSAGISSSAHDPSLAFSECATIDEWMKAQATARGYDVIVDALFGTGLTRPLEGMYANAVEYIDRERAARSARDEPPSGSEARPLIVSLDVPSGLNADASELIGHAVHADLTVTFTAPKAANVLPPASHLNGQLIVAHIGSPSELIDEAASQLYLTESADARAWLKQTRYTPESYKNTHGHALVIAGSRGLSGAAVLCGEAAMRAGAGLVTIATAESAMAAIASRVMPEVMTMELAETSQGAVSAEAIERVLKLVEKTNVVAIGPGLTSNDEQTRRFARAVVEQRKTPVVIDADGLNALAPWPANLKGSPERPLLLTPHIGEMRRLLGVGEREALTDRVRVAREFATAHQLILVLKGSRTLVAAPDGRVSVNPTGNAGLGTGGAGDTLTGIITGFLAQVYGTLKDQADAFLATLAAVYVGGMAGDFAARALGMRTMVASDLREHLSAAIRALDPQGEQP